jgi:branched-chain amino acid aminotransferase
MLQQFDPRNTDIQVYVNGSLHHRDAGVISVFDSVVQGGDAVWEGLRLYSEGIICLSHHLQRLQESAHTLAFNDVPTLHEIRQALKQTLEANKMHDGVHIRLTLTRGVKITSGMDPRLNQSGCTLIIVPEYKAPVYDNDTGIKIMSSSQRRNNPQFLDSKIHHNNLLNNILAKIQSNMAGMDAALMLDEHGFASELNGTNIFTIKNGMVMTPHAHNCLPGITRKFIIQLCEENDVNLIEKNISLSELYNADEVFCSGTMGELTPIVEIDGRKIINTTKNSIFAEINRLFRASIPRYCEKL